MHSRPIAPHPKPTRRRGHSFLCRVLYLGLLWAWGGAASPAAAASKAPPLPLAPCTNAVAWQNSLPQDPQETVRYRVMVDGLSVGSINFQIARTGTFSGKPAVEYRSVFELDHLLAAMADIRGRAAAVVPLDSASPQSAMSHYSMGDTLWHEELSFSQQGRAITAQRQVTPPPARAAAPEDVPKVVQPIVDFVTGFYLVRRLPAQTATCMTVYAAQHHYVVWVTPEGTERTSTPIGMRPADVFGVRYQRLGRSTVGSGRIWLSQTAERLPYRIVIKDDRRIEACLHTFAMGRSPDGIKPPYSVASD